MGNFIVIVIATALANVVILHLGAIALVKTGVIKLDGAPDWLSPWNLEKVKEIALNKKGESNILISFNDGKGPHEEILTLAKGLLEFKDYKLGQPMRIMDELKESEERTASVKNTPILVTLNGKKSIAA